MSSVDQPVLSPHFPVLDTLRGVGALAVLTTHTMFWSGDYLGNGWLGTLWARLDIGVALFFVLSGFLLSRPWLVRRELSLPAPRTRTYLSRRFRRIFPAYAVVVVISMSLLTDNQDASVGDWVTTLLLAGIYTDDELPAGLTHMWSLSTEVAFYLFLPLVMLVVVRGAGRRWVGAVLLGLALACGTTAWWLLEGAWHPSLAERAMPLQWLPSYLPWFGAGILMALVHVVGCREEPPFLIRHLHAALRGLGRAPGACLVAALGLLMVASTPLAGPPLLAAPTPAQLLTKVLLYTVWAVLVVAPAIFGDPSSRYADVMSLRPLRHLGRISYSLFCIHLPVSHLVIWSQDLEPFTGHGFRIWASTVVLSIAAAQLLYVLVEKPALGRRRTAESRATPNQTPATAAATR